MGIRPSLATSASSLFARLVCSSFSPLPALFSVLRRSLRAALVRRPAAPCTMGSGGGGACLSSRAADLWAHPLPPRAGHGVRVVVAGVGFDGQCGARRGSAASVVLVGPLARWIWGLATHPSHGLSASLPLPAPAVAAAAQPTDRPRAVPRPSGGLASQARLCNQAAGTMARRGACGRPWRPNSRDTARGPGLGGPPCPSLRLAPTTAPCASPPHRVPPPSAAPPRCPRFHPCGRAPAPQRLASPPRARSSLPPKASCCYVRLSGGLAWWGERSPGRHGWVGWRRQRMTRLSGAARPLAWDYRHRLSSGMVLVSEHEKLRTRLLCPRTEVRLSGTEQPTPVNKIMMSRYLSLGKSIGHFPLHPACLQAPWAGYELARRTISVSPTLSDPRSTNVQDAREARNLTLVYIIRTRRCG
ncbi:hypothetical protein U9M48_032123 [Paspalum notatum var. saurae]|uniref:Uncharacterized protein n=1 Tax=Paspalum notatum var. saurae TaxID=547442 RepID=A0AAQ3U4E5_PASNO